MESCPDTMQLYANRLMSFDHWPANHPIAPHCLAVNGFYHFQSAVYSDNVRCAFCKVEICRWQPHDNVEEDHKRWAPQCKLVRKLVDIDGGYNAMHNHTTVAAPAIDECGSTSTHYAHPQYRTYQSRLDTFKNNEWPAAIPISPDELATAGFFYTGKSDRVKCFACDGGLKEWTKGDDAFKLHARWFDRCSYVIKTKGTEYIKSAMNENGNPSAPPPPSSSQLSAPLPENNEENACKICFENRRNATFVPCGHVVACYTCALSVDSCPMCRHAITTIVKLFFS
ncbi:IAP-3 [Mythimna sequax nucleopolyhedrovirus]|nr:IAP-3 [Mythimna sequax nucleopolyhedrovirus]